MNCDNWIELARCGAQPGAAQRRHLESCAECRRALDAQLSLQAALAALDLEPAPADLEQRVLAQFDAAQSRRSPVRWPWATAAALAATALAIAIATRPPAPPPRAAEAPFYQIPYTAPLAPYERTRIVRMHVPVAALIAAGFEVHAPDTGAALEADVLFGQDGRAHAIRPVPNFTQEN